VVIQMVWWEAVLFFAAVIFAIYAFASIVGFRTRTLTRPTDRTAQDMYDNYADSPRKQRRYAPASRRRGARRGVGAGFQLGQEPGFAGSVEPDGEVHEAGVGVA
jgi:hypothetical protein